MTRNIAREVADELGCEFIQEIGREEAPIRGAAARRGVSCELEGVLVDVFEWSGEGDLANIYVRVGHREGLNDPCGWLAVGDRWFLVAGDRNVLTRAVEELGDGGVSELLPVSPIASYQVPGVSRCGG